MVKIGCCGFPVSKKKYFENLNLVEVQRTFYDPPEKAVVERWAREKPPLFEYTIKAWQLITHPPQSPTYKRLKRPIPRGKEGQYGFFKGTEEVFGAWRTIEEVARMLGSKVILFQTPKGFLPTLENRRNIEHFFSSIGRDFVFCLELRGWQDKEVVALCRELDLVPVLDPFLSSKAFGTVAYFRLHGRLGYSYRYSTHELLTLKDALPFEKEVYVLFNNMYMFENALEFKDIIYRS